jgi:hypothetical protein
MQLYTKREIAAALSEANGQPFDLIHPQVSNAAAKGFLCGAVALDGRQTAAFEPVEIYRAAVFCAVVSIGLAITRVGPAIQRAGDLSGIIEAVTARAEPWSLRIAHVHDRASRTNTHRVSFIRDDQPDEPMTAEEVAALDASFPNREVLATTVIRFADLWAGLPSIPATEAEG